MNQLLWGIQFNDCEDTNRGCVGHTDTQWARMLAYITGLVDQELLVRTEYLAAESRILRAQLKGRLRLVVKRKEAGGATAAARYQCAEPRRTLTLYELNRGG